MHRFGPSIQAGGNPGPGQYDSQGAIGHQVESRMASTSGAKFSRKDSNFPVANRDQAAKVFSGQESIYMVYSPGPGMYLQDNRY